MNKSGWKSFFNQHPLNNQIPYDPRLPIKPTKKPCNAYVGDGYDEFRHAALAIIKSTCDLQLVPTDKNIGIAILTIHPYDAMVQSHLGDGDTYRMLTTGEHQQHLLQLSEISTMLLTRVKSTYTEKPQQYRFLRQNGPETARTPFFHVLPKLHKPRAEGQILISRPIVGATNSMTTPWSKLLDTWLTEYRCQHTLLSSAEVLAQPTKRTFPANSHLVSLDAVSLYTTIRQTELRSAVYEAMVQARDQGNAPVNRSLVAQTLDLVLQGNTFQYNGEFYI